MLKHLSMKEQPAKHPKADPPSPGLELSEKLRAHPKKVRFLLPNIREHFYVLSVVFSNLDGFHYFFDY